MRKVNYYRMTLECFIVQILDCYLKVAVGVQGIGKWICCLPATIMH